MKLKRLEAFFTENKKGNKGTLCVGLVVTRYALENGLPIDFNSILTENQGQISILGKAQVQRILVDHGITRVLAEEGGRTNRGNIGLAKKYVAFLNEKNFTTPQIKEIEMWWIEKVKAFFAGKPMALRMDSAKSMRAVVRDLLTQAERRQVGNVGSTVVGTVLQHLVGAKLSLLMENPPTMHGASVADAVSDRDGDFILDDIVIHVTSAPSEALMRKCSRNLDAGLRPLIITTYAKAPFAEALAESMSIADRVDVFDIEQFIGSNLYELGAFAPSGRRETAERLIDAYNSIVRKFETDPSLQITMGP